MWKKTRNELAGMSAAASIIFDKMLSKGAASVVGTTALFYETQAGYQYIETLWVKVNGKDFGVW